MFGACTADLELLADWLMECGVTSVAMESKGVYWVPLFELLERRGFEVFLVDPRADASRASGRPKTDVLELPMDPAVAQFGLAGAVVPPVR